MKIAVIDGKAFEIDENYNMKPIDDGVFDVKGKKQDVRTLQQNKAFWKWADMLAMFFNQHGLYVEKIIKMETEWTKYTVKANIFNKVIESLGKKSSTQLTKQEIDVFIDVVVKSFAYKGVEIPAFPSYES